MPQIIVLLEVVMKNLIELQELDINGTDKIELRDLISINSLRVSG